VERVTRRADHATTAARSVVSAQGGMATGKTKAVVRMLRRRYDARPRSCSSAGRALCSKYARDARRRAPTPRHNKLPGRHGTHFAHERVIVCLDSIERVDNNFDFVIVDRGVVRPCNFNGSTYSAPRRHQPLRAATARQAHLLPRASVDSTVVRDIIDTSRAH
jgi:hypothetical protein